MRIAPFTTRLAMLGLLLAVTACERSAPPKPTEPASEAPVALPPTSAPNPNLVTFDPHAYGFEVKQRYPIAWRAWEVALQSQNIPRAVWLYDLEGTSSPIIQVTLEGRELHYADVCEPHNCGPNRVGMLIAPDQSRIVGVWWQGNGSSDGTTRTPIGDPTPAELACLNLKMENEDAAC